MNSDMPLTRKIQDDDVEWEYIKGEEGRSDVIRWKTFLGGVDADAENAAHNTQGITMGVCEVPPGAKLDAHYHAEHEVYYVQHGSGEVLLGDKTVTVESGSCIYVPGDLTHGIKNQGEATLTLLWIFPTDTWSEVRYHMQTEQDF